jgi:hypothetical protein
MAQQSLVGYGLLNIEVANLRPEPPSVLGCYTVSTGVWLVTGSSEYSRLGIPRSTLLGLLIPKRNSGPLVTSYHSTWRNNPQDLVLPQRRCEISQSLRCTQVGNLGLQELSCTMELENIRAHRKLRQAVVSTALLYFLSSSLRKCS